MIYDTVQRVYDAVIRKRTPVTMGSCAGVPAKHGRLLDATESWPHYKQGLIESIYTHCEGEQVELVGLGRGVSSVHAVRAGATEVIAYEAAAEMIETATDTFRGCPYDSTERVDIRHALVGDDVEVYGEDMGSPVSPADLEGHAVLVMDCEGAETSILAGLEHVPSVTIVETHPERGVPTAETRVLLEEMYDDIRDHDYEPDDDEGKRVLVGVQK